MSALSDEANEVILCLELVTAHRNHVARRQAKKPDAEESSVNEMRIEALTERINQLLGGLSNAGYEVEYHNNTTVVRKDGQIWLEKTDWTEYAVVGDEEKHT